MPEIEIATRSHNEAMYTTMGGQGGGRAGTMLDEVAKDSSLLLCIINHFDKGWDDTDSAIHNDIFSHPNGLDIHHGNHCSS